MVKRLVLGMGTLVLGTAAIAGELSVAKWDNDAAGAFTLMFDDGWPSAKDVAMPELKKRGLSATFYIVPAKGEYTAKEAEWLAAFAKNPEFVAGNHTMTHNGFTTYEGAVAEFQRCTDYLLAKMPGKKPRLISYAQPGVENWYVDGKWMSGEMEKAICDSQNLVSRPPFANHGAVYHLTNRVAMTALAEKAVKEKSYEYVVFHGVEDLADWRTGSGGYQDFWAMKQAEFLPFFDDVQSMQATNGLWVADHISVHKYETERNCTVVTPLATSDGSVAFTVACVELDTELYDQPLCIRVEMPTGWTAARYRQAVGAEQMAVVRNGFALVKALPGAGVVSVWSAAEETPEVVPEPIPDPKPDTDEDADADDDVETKPEPVPEPEPEGDIVILANQGTVRHEGILDVAADMTIFVGADSRYVVTNVTGAAKLIKRGAGTLAFTNGGSKDSDRSSRRQGVTVVEEGVVEFGVHKSYQLGNQVEIGGAGKSATVKFTNTDSFDIDVFKGWMNTDPYAYPGNIVVKDKGLFDLSANPNSPEVRSFNSLRIEKGGVADIGSVKLGFTNTKDDSLWVEGTLRSRPAGQIRMMSGNFTVPSSVESAIVWPGSWVVQYKYDGSVYYWHGARFVIDDNEKIPVEVELQGPIGNYGSAQDCFEKRGNGVLRLRGSSSYGGDLGNNGGRTVVRAGTLLADNETGSATGKSKVEVVAGGTLGGVGTVVGFDISNDENAALVVKGNETTLATVHPGTIDDETGAHIVGTLTAGSAEQACLTTFDSYSQLKISLGGSGVDRLTVNGAVAIAETNTTLSFDVGNDTIRIVGRHTILSATKGITGSFAQVVSSGRRFTPQFNEDRTEMYIDVPGALMIVVR